MAEVLPPPIAYLKENEALMSSLQREIYASTGIPENDFILSACFSDNATDVYFPHLKFLIALDVSHGKHLERVKSVVKAHGIPEEQTSIRLTDIFLRKAMENATDILIEEIEAKLGVKSGNETFGRYAAWMSETNPHLWSPTPMIPIWFKDAQLLQQIGRSEKFDRSVDLDTGNGRVVKTDIILIYAP